MRKKRKYKSNKPMFKRKRSPAKTVFNVILVIVLLSAIAFLGYSVGKPIMEFLGNRERPTTSDTPSTEPAPEKEPPVTTTTPAEDDAKETEPEPDKEPEPEPQYGKRILYVSMPAGGSYEQYIAERVQYAKDNGYYGVALELLADGGAVRYATANPLATSTSAVSAGAIADLSAAAKTISDAGMFPYARISVLSDHIVSWDKSICYLFENSTSTWLDNSVELGGKPWMSAFSAAAREYVASLVTEISDAGFAGVVAGEIEFPPFRNSDLNYIGASVKSATRYNGLIEFSNVLQDAFGTAKVYAVEVDAQDIVAGRAEVLRDLNALNAQTIYVKYDSAAVGLRIVRTDETEISYSGLSEADKLTVVMKSVYDTIGNGKTIIPAVTDEALIPTLVSLGYDEQSILVY